MTYFTNIINTCGYIASGINAATGIVNFIIGGMNFLLLSIIVNNIKIEGKKKDESKNRIIIDECKNEEEKKIREDILKIIKDDHPVTDEEKLMHYELNKLFKIEVKV
jgi:hypothetical protein